MMTLSKAYEILDLNLKEAGTKMPKDCQEAVKLAMEALHRIAANRADPEFDHYLPLKGEHFDPTRDHQHE